MKTTMSWVLVLVLTAQAAFVTARQRVETTPGPIRLAMTREAIRLAAQPAPPPRTQGDNHADASWARVRTLSPGTEVLVTMNAWRHARRYVLSVDATSISVIDLTAASVPPAVESTLRTIASSHPDYFIAARHRGYVMDKQLRLNPDGLFVGDRKVADLDQLVRRVPRTEISELRFAHFHVGRSVRVGLLVGLGAGFLLGRLNDCSACDDPGLVTIFSTGWGAGLGAVGGLVVGSIKASSPSEAGALLYQAP